MSVTIKNLASGTLTNTTAKVVGPVSGKAWLVKSIMLTNRDSAARTLDLKVTGTSPNTVAYIAPPGMSVGPSTTVIVDNEITLQYPSGGSQETVSIGVTGTAASPGLDYVLNGLERDLS